LWRAIQRDDNNAFALLYESTVLPLSKLAYKLLKDKELTRDILQDIYVSLYMRRHELPADVNIAGYLHNAVRYKVSTVLRDRLAKESHHVHLLRREEQAELTQPDVYEHTALKKRIRAGIDTLPQKCRQAFMMNHYGSLSYKAIAHEMGISVKTVEKHISKALQLLRKELSEEQYMGIAIVMISSIYFFGNTML
jgi:RNA polymerase sigma-70 factor (family 1)